ncbi:MAG: helix-turn-helix transcriptional regulator [Bacteroidetes bacterium]|nr:helix-turn-helix transcriptional regulator [Bacteroidota bacterium]
MIFYTLNLNDAKENLSLLIKDLRKKNKLSQSELAEKLNVSRITIQNMEAANNITIDNFLKVLQYFHLLEKFNSLLKDEIENTQIKSLY